MCRLARPGEDAAIAAFVNDHFDMRLPLITRPEMYRYYYAGADGAPRFAVAEEDGRFVAVAGYIPASRAPGADIWVSIWAAAKGRNGVGLALMEALPRLTGARVVACNNIRPRTMAFYRFLGWEAGRLRHYYRLNPDTAPALCQNAQTAPPAGGDAVLARVEDAAALTALGLPPAPHTPRKDLAYLIHRYFENPWFSYDVWAARAGGELLGYAVTRTVPVTDTGCVPVVRLVDFIGADDALPRIGKALDGILRAAGAEYMDCYNTGIAPEVFCAAGFCERREGDGAVVSNYLAPPLRENTEYYYFTSAPESFVMFKADGDQDRPNLP